MIYMPGPAGMLSLSKDIAANAAARRDTVGAPAIAQDGEVFSVRMSMIDSELSKDIAASAAAQHYAAQIETTVPTAAIRPQTEQRNFNVEYSKTVQVGDGSTFTISSSNWPAGVDRLQKMLASRDGQLAAMDEQLARLRGGTGGTAAVSDAAVAARDVAHAEMVEHLRDGWKAPRRAA